MAPLLARLGVGGGSGFGFAGNRGGIVPLNIGDAYEGGFFAGYISHTANGVATHGLIVGPSAGAPQWKTTNTSTAGTTSLFDGALNSANMNNASHPAAQFCEGLTTGGYSDWYLPALYELDIAYQNLKPSTANNNTSFGINDYSVPKRTANRTAGAPGQTSIAAFQSGGTEAFESNRYWASTEADSGTAWGIGFNDGWHSAFTKSGPSYVRAFRKFAL